MLQFLESDKFDAAVMDFVDEKCYVFYNDEENKFIYTDIYHEYLEHVSFSYQLKFKPYVGCL